MIDQLRPILTSQPGTFAYGGKPSETLMPDWELSSSAQDGSTTKSIWTDPDTGLLITTTLTWLLEGEAAEWTVDFTNGSSTPTPVIETIRPLDVILPVEAGAQPLMETLHGSTCSLDDFVPIERELLMGSPVHLEPRGGRSSDGAMPFFSLDTGSTQFACAIGWSGQWVVDLTLDPSGVHLQAGLQDARLRLLPGETIRTPTVLIVAVAGENRDAVNRLRSLLLQHYVPKSPTGGPVTPIAHMTMATFHQTGIATEQNEIAAVAKTAALGLEAYWVDACWYGNTTDWSQNVGNWFIRTESFPRGLRPVSDAAHAAGMKFVLWLEPERAKPDSALAIAHPEFFLEVPDQPGNLLLDLGREDARSYVLDLISGLITDFGVDIYRQDFNVPPLSAWRSADEADRTGITEIRHVEGLYALWDELLKRHPGLVIDNCASGGRRIDLETMRRSVPLWRSDFADVGGGAAEVGISTANQIQTAGLTRWIPQHTGPIWSFDAYSTRSAMSTGVVIYRELPLTESENVDAMYAVSELKRLRPRMQGDFHLLTPITVSDEAWCAYQLHDPVVNAGFALFFRRSDGAEQSRTFVLHGITEGQYEVTESNSYELGELVRVSGAELEKTCISLASAPSSVLLEYSIVN